MSSSALVHAQTEVRMERITYNWSIKRFDFLPEDVDEKIWSPWFHPRDTSEKWRLEFYPRGKRGNSSEDIDYVALYLARDSPGKSDINVRVEMSISISNKLWKNSSFTHKYGPQMSHGYRKFLVRSKLIITDSFDDDEFTITCVIDIPVEVITSSFAATTFDSKKRQLSDDFRLLFEHPILSDFTIIVGNQKIPTHRNILAGRSPVFAAMFKHEDLEENRKKEVKIENIEPDVIKAMLEFIYTDEVSNIKELASGLLEAANKYDLEKLRIMCEETLYDGLNKENAAEVLLLADFHHAHTLKKCVMKYIVDHATEVITSNNWKEIGKNPALLLEFVEHSFLPQATTNEKSQIPKE